MSRATDAKSEMHANDLAKPPFRRAYSFALVTAGLFLVSWVGAAATERAGQIGVQSLAPEKCIWDTTTLPPMAADMYTAPPPKVQIGS